MVTRDEIRTKFFAQTPKSRVVEINGVPIEVRQPSIGDLLALSGDRQEDSRDVMVRLLISYCYVPGTDEKVFDYADKDLILSLPNNKAWQDLQTAISELTSLGEELKEAAKNSEETLSEG